MPSFEDSAGRSQSALAIFDRVLSVLKAERAGLITDIDGTISYLAASPAAARVSQPLRSHLAALAARLTLVAIVSGRSCADSRALIGLDGLVYVGNHGLEMFTRNGLVVQSEARVYRHQIAALLEELRPVCRRLAGVIVEDKGATASVHYRLVERAEEARKTLLEAIHNSPLAAGLSITEGKMVIEVRPPVQVNKGTAVRNLIEEYSLIGVAYLGDDLTDVDAFETLASLDSRSACRCLSIAVAGPETPERVRSVANLHLDGVSEVEHMLGLLARALTP